MANGTTIAKLDGRAVDIAKDLEVTVYSLEGLFEKFAREQPNMIGLRQFYQVSTRLLVDALQATLTKIGQARIALEASLSDAELTYSMTLTDSDVYAREQHDAVWGAFQQAQSAYVKRFREIVASRAAHSDTFTPDPKVMTRNGRKWNFTEFMYVMVRGILVTWYNNAKIGYIASIDGTEFTLDTTDESLLNQLYKVSDYPDLANDLFHPRTNNLVGGLYVST